MLFETLLIVSLIVFTVWVSKKFIKTNRTKKYYKSLFH